METDHQKSPKKKEKTDDCLACRLIGTGGAVAGAAYIAYQSRKTNSIATKAASLSFSAGFLVLGYWRWKKKQ